MDLDAPFGSPTVSQCAHRTGQAFADLTGVTWSAQMGQARVDVDLAADGAATLRVSGELDLASAPLIEHAFRIMHAAHRQRVRADLSAVGFCDCAGLSAFIVSDRLLRRAGGQLTFSRLSAPVRRLLTLMETHHEFVLDRPVGETASGQCADAELTL